MQLDEKDIQILKLRVALESAPRPQPSAGAAWAEWMVKYMDWFFQNRISVLEETGAKQAHR